MAVFRVERNKGYTVMSNHHLRNKELSLKAKGLLSQMLSLPEDWDYTLKGLSLINREKIDAIREAIKELERAGYIVRSRERDEKGRLWFCRPSGTHCFRERDVFLKDTAPHNTWRFYMEQTSDRVLAYAIELTGKERGKIKGNLYELDYAKHYERVKEKELPADTVKLIYERGEREIPAGRFFNGNPDPQLGKFERFEALPDDPDALQSLLQEERRSREQLPPGDFKAHITALRDGLIETEARRIVREMKRHYEPNSPNKTHFMAELSPAFMRLAATKDTDRLFSMLPYKTLSFSKIEGRHGTYALIDKGENRDREIRKPRPSIRAQLKADKAKTAPKKAAAKTKNHDMEV